MADTYTPKEIHAMTLAGPGGVVKSRGRPYVMGRPMTDEERRARAKVYARTHARGIMRFVYGDKAIWKPLDERASKEVKSIGNWIKCRQWARAREGMRNLETIIQEMSKYHREISDKQKKRMEANQTLESQ